MFDACRPRRLGLAAILLGLSGLWAGGLRAQGASFGLTAAERSELEALIQSEGGRGGSERLDPQCRW